MAKSTKKTTEKTRTRKDRSPEEQSFYEAITLAEILERKQGILTAAGAIIGIINGITEGNGLFGIACKGLLGATAGHCASHLADKLYAISKKRPSTYNWIKGSILGLVTKKEAEEIAGQ